MNQPQNPIILFDGICNLCSASVQFIIKRDPEAQFRFASLQSKAARKLLEPFPVKDEAMNSIILIEIGQRYERSTAALRIASRLQFYWPLLRFFLIVPEGIRDAVYDWIARNRYRWFGRRDVCWIPDERYSDRFLDDREWMKG